MFRKLGFIILSLTIAIVCISDYAAGKAEPPDCGPPCPEFPTPAESAAVLSRPMISSGLVITELIPGALFEVIFQAACRGGRISDTITSPDWPLYPLDDPRPGSVFGALIPFADIIASDFEGFDIQGTDLTPDQCEPQGAVGLNLTGLMGFRNNGETISARGMLMFWVCPCHAL